MLPQPCRRTQTEEVSGCRDFQIRKHDESKAGRYATSTIYLDQCYSGGLDSAGSIFHTKLHTFGLPGLSPAPSHGAIVCNRIRMFRKHAKKYWTEPGLPVLVFFSSSPAPRALFILSIFSPRSHIVIIIIIIIITILITILIPVVI